MEHHVSVACRVESTCVVRVAGLPARVLAELRFDRTTALVDEVLASDAWLTGEGRALSDALYSAIGDLPGPGPLKPRLVGLRRAIHSGRRPRANEWNEETARALPAAVADRVRCWIGARDDREELASALPNVLASETSAKVTALRQVTADGRFRHGLAHSSPQLCDELDKWLHGGPVDQQVLRRLVRYVSRAAAKTSPYSTFTSTGIAHWVPGNGTAVCFQAAVVDHGLVDLHGATLPELERALALRTELHGALRVRVNPSTVRFDGRLTFLGTPPGEPVVEVAASPAVTSCLDAIADIGPSCTVDGLRRRLRGGSDDPALADRVAAFVDKLADTGLLEVRLPISDQCDDPLRALADWLDAAGGQRYREVATACRTLRTELVAPTVPDEVTRHRERLLTIQREVGGLGRMVGLDWDDIAAARTGAVHENTVFAQPMAELAAARWRPALDDLDAIRRWLALHDPVLPLRLVLGAYCRERFGAGARVPLLRLHRSLREDLASGAPPRPGCSIGAAQLRRFLAPFPEPGDGGVERVRELLAARRQAALAVLRKEPGRDGTIQIDAHELADAVRGFPTYVTTPPSVACFVSPWIEDGQLRLAVNTILSGHGRARSRWLRLARRAAGLAAATDQPEDGVPVASSPDRVVAEVSGVFGYPFNVRLPSQPYEIDYPHTVSDRPAGQRIPLGDLIVVHDPALDTVRLRAASLDVDVLPVHTGLQAEILLPSALQLVVRGFGASPTLQPPGRLLFQPDVASRPEAVLALPRVNVGGVTLQRATWIVPHHLAPVRAMGEPDAEYLVRLHAWLRTHGIPAECFVQVFTRSGPDSPQAKMTKARKPLYIDFANWFLCTVFERLLAGPSDTVVFREALPTPADAITPDTGDPRVSEIIIELSERGDG
jgi:hypothetical protein